MGDSGATITAVTGIDTSLSQRSPVIGGAVMEAGTLRCEAGKFLFNEAKSCSGGGEDKSTCCRAQTHFTRFKANAHPFTGVGEADNWEPFHTGSSGRIFNEIHELICLPSQLSDTDVKQRSLRVTGAEPHRTPCRIGNGCLAQPAPSVANHNIPMWESHDLSRVEEVRIESGPLLIFRLDLSQES